MGCRKLTYHTTESLLKVVYRKAVKYENIAQRFISVDPKTAKYTSLSPYCYSANSPIQYVDENGEGPLATILRFSTFVQRTIAKWTGKTVKKELSATLIGGLGLASAGLVANGGMAIDKHGNIGIYSSGEAFATAFTGSDYYATSSGTKEAKYNVVVGGEVSVSAGLSFSSKDNVLKLAGTNQALPGFAGFDISGKAGLGGELSFDGDEFGAAIGFGIGGSVSVIANNTFVVAFTIKDVEIFEDATAYINKAKKKGSTVTYDSHKDKNGFTTLSATIQTTKRNGRVKEKTKELLSVKKDKERNAVYTKNVKR